jgi:hypothetical protein
MSASEAALRAVGASALSGPAACCAHPASPNGTLEVPPNDKASNVAPATEPRTPTPSRAWRAARGVASSESVRAWGIGGARRRQASALAVVTNAMAPARSNQAPVASSVTRRK